MSKSGKKAAKRCITGKRRVFAVGCILRQRQQRGTGFPPMATTSDSTDSSAKAHTLWPVATWPAARLAK